MANRNTRAKTAKGAKNAKNAKVAGNVKAAKAAQAAPAKPKPSQAAKKRAQEAEQNRRKKEKTGIKDYLKGVRLEMKKVVWPTRKEMSAFFVVVVIACAFFALAFYAIDSGFLALLSKMLGITF